jgi:hypothetical protein
MFTRSAFYLFSLTLILCIGTSKAQEGSNFFSAEDSLVKMIRALAKETNQSQKIDLNQTFTEYFRQVLERDGSFDYSFDSLKYLGKLISPDRILRIYTWNLPLYGGLNQYFGFIQVKWNGAVSLYTLTDSRVEFEVPQIEGSSPEKWFGALYYYMHQTEHAGKVFYTLLGVDFNNLFSKKRVIEVITLSEQGVPIIGPPIFSIRNHLINRIIFEYSARANMVLRYDENFDMIVFDHLAPFRPDFQENYQFYGPDFTFDALQFIEGKWVYKPNIDVRNPKRENIPTPIEAPEVNPEPGFLYRSEMGNTITSPTKP